MKIAIVGGGFAGMYAAARLSVRRDIGVTVFDAKARPGHPANTTGGIAKTWIDRFLPFMSGTPETDRCITAHITSVKLVGPSGGEALLSSDNPFLSNRMGVVLDEPNTIEWLEEYAKCASSVEVQRPVRITDVKHLDGFDRVILADGWASKIGTQLGMTPPLHPLDQHQGFEYVIRAQKQDPGQIEIYLGQRVAPAGYVWDFPAQMGSVRRFGVGIPLAENRKRSALSYLQEFADAHGIDISAPVAKEGGVIPTGPASKVIHKGKYFAIGDAAHWCDPLSIHPDEPVYVSTERGVRVVPIKEVKKGWKVASLDLDTLKVGFKLVSDVLIHPNTDRMYEVVLQTGRKIRVTGSHSLFVLRNGAVTPTPTTQITPDDYVLAPMQLPQADKTVHMDADLAALMGLYLAEGHVHDASQRRKGPWHLRLTFGLNDPAYDYAVRCSDRLNLKHGTHVSSWKRTLAVYARHEDSRILTPSQITVIREMRAAGGTVQQIADRFHRGSDSIQMYLDGWKSQQQTTSVDLLQYEWPRGAHTKYVPEIMWNVDTETKQAFLAGYLMGDGTISADGEFSFTTVSNRLAFDIVYLMQSLGITATLTAVTIRERIIRGRALPETHAYQIAVRGHDQIVRTERIWGLHWNSDKLRTYVGRVKREHAWITSIPVLGDAARGRFHDMKICRRRFYDVTNTNIRNDRLRSDLEYMRIFADSDLLFLKVRSIREIESPEFVYDLSVPGHENFVASGIVAHNTGGGIFPALASADAVVSYLTGDAKTINLGWLYREMRLRYRLKYILINMQDRSLDRLVERMNITFNGPELNPITERKRLLPKIIIPLIPDIIDAKLHGSYRTT